MSFELAQLNVAILKEPIDSPALADFVANLEGINALAEAAPGFRWRLQDDQGNATALRPLGEETLVNMSVWQDAETLRAYVYESAHTEIMRRRKEWFGRTRAAYQVLWWVPQGHHPTLEEGIAKLDLLRDQGPTPRAFSFRQIFPPPAA